MDLILLQDLRNQYISNKCEFFKNSARFLKNSARIKQWLFIVDKIFSIGHLFAEMATVPDEVLWLFGHSKRENCVRLSKSSN